jgi:hypothetical protein
LAPNADPADRARAMVCRAILSETLAAGCLEQLEESLRIYRRIGDSSGTGHSLRMLGFYYSLRRDEERAMSAYRDALAVFQSTGDVPGEAVTLLCISFAPNNHSTQVGEDAGRRSLELYRELGNRWGIELANVALIEHARNRGAAEAEAGYAAEAVHAHQADGVPRVPELVAQARLALLRGHREDSIRALKEAALVARDSSDPSGVAMIARLYLEHNIGMQHDRRARFLGAIAAIDGSLGRKFEGRIRRDSEKAYALLVNRIGKRGFDRAFRAGQLLSAAELADELIDDPINRQTFAMSSRL